MFFRSDAASLFLRSENGMNKVMLMAGAMLMLSSIAFAGEKKEVACAVMTDHKVNIKKATAEKMYTDYKGKRYFFCCAGCSPTFKKEPATYAKKAESIPTPKATPVKKKS
jgi:YHS domain-containing protein